MFFTRFRNFFSISFEYINRVSLDAPLVVLAWQEIISNGLNVELAISQRFVFFLSVWLAYSGDRYLECFGRKSGKILFNRHLYFYNHQKLFIAMWFLVLIVSLLVTTLSFTPTQIFYCLGLFLIVVINQLLSYYEPKHISKLLSKSQRTTILLTVGSVFLPLILCREFKVGTYISTILLLFLFWINCVLNNYWERIGDVNRKIGSHLFQNTTNNWFYKIFLGLILMSTVFLLTKLNITIVLSVSILTTLYMVILLYKSELNFECKRIYLDQFYWLIPSSYIVLDYVYDL